MSTVPLLTSRLVFRAWRDDDLPIATALFGDPKVTALVGGPFDERAVQERLATELANQRTHAIAYWPIFEYGGELVGCCGLKPRVPERRSYELGFYLRPAYWGRGFAAEAGQSVITHAWDVLDAATLFAGHHPENHGSRRALEKLGFRYTHHELYPPTGLEHPGYELVRATA
jgi:[ribosomal protein S5]-alanine N-acetyltransferase